MLYRRKSDNYVARKRMIFFSCYDTKVTKKQTTFLKLLILIKPKINLLETFSQKKMGRARRFQRNKVNWWTEETFKQTLRVSKAAFYYVLSKIQNRICKEFVVEASFNPDKRLVICLYCLARPDYLCTIGEMVRIPESSVCQIVAEVCTAIIEEFWLEKPLKFIFLKQMINSKKNYQIWMLNGSFRMLFLQLMEPIFLLNVTVVDKRQ